MVAYVGGVVALVLGIIGIVFWWSYVLDLLKGVIPFMLIPVGALATYFGFDQIREKKTVEVYDPIKREFRREIDTLRQELDDLKNKRSSKP